MAAHDMHEPRRARLRTNDPGEIEQALDDTYAAHTHLTEGAATLTFTRDEVSIGSIRVIRVVSSGLTLSIAALHSLLVVECLSGTYDLHTPSGQAVLHAGEIGLAAQPDEPCQVRLRGSPASFRTTRVNLDLINEAAAAAVAAKGGDPADAAPVRFLDLRPSSPEAAARWRYTVDYLHQIIRDPQVAHSDVMLGNAARLAAATALTVFENTAITPDEPGAVGQPALPCTVGLALAFIEAHLADEPTLVDIARAASVTPRAIQLAFRRHLDTTPSELMRRMRLARARDELLAADPTAGISVGAVAARWRFSHAGRFARAYQAAYGETPSQSLRRG